MSTEQRAIRVAVCYLLLGIGWILFSDRLLMALVADLETFARIGRYKGLCFVVLTTALIYALLRHAPLPRTAPAGSAWPLLTIFAALVLAIVAVGANQVHDTRARRQAASMADLRAVSQLKRQEVADWLAVRARETASLRDSIELPRGWPGSPVSAAAGARVESRLQALGRTLGADAIWLVDADGRVLIGQAGDELPASAGWRDLLRQAGNGGMPHSGLFKHAQHWHIDFAVALTRTPGRPPVFAVTRFDPADSLFAHFGDWPLPSASAEVLLFSRAGDRVLVLNPVRYRQADAGAGFTLPLSSPDLLSARTLRGEIALDAPVEGVDYRGRPTVGVAQRVPGTHWFLLAKMDRDELFAGGERDIARLVGSYLLVLLLAGAAAAYLYQRRGLAQAALLRQAQAERLRTLQLIDAIAAASSDAIFAKDREGRYILVNAAACRVIGRGEAQILGHRDDELFPPEYAAAYVADDRAIMAAGQARTYEESVSTPAGVRIYMTTKGPLPDPAGGVRGVYAITRDITERKQAEAELAQAAMVVSSTQDGVMITDARGRILHVNQAFSAITGYAEHEICGQTARMLHSGRQTAADYAAMWQVLGATGSWQGEIWNRRKNGEVYPEWLSINAVRAADGQLTHYVGVFTDISRLKRSEAELAHLAEYDPLTDLPNRRQINLRLQGALQRCQRHGGRLAVLYLDLDHFKNINDSLGHHAGDELLLGVAARLRARLREEDLFGRLGGDEFLVLLEGLEQPEQAAVVARDLLAALTAPFLLNGHHEVYATGSIGISIYPEDGCEDGELLRNADTAMYRAKSQGRNQFCFYTGEMNAEAQARLALEAAMRHALEREEFQLHYQPKVETGSGRIAGAEALLRWQRREGGAVSPAVFIPLAEQCGLIGEIGRWVVDRACADLAGWREQGLSVVPVAVNVSARQFMSGEVETVVGDALARHGVAAGEIELELTESVLMERPEAAAATLGALKEAGLRLALDDFGTGYSSLSYLMRFPMDVLKIDQSFVRELAQRPGAATLAGAVIALAHRMGMKVVAEGVETREQLDFLREQGCELVQGYYFSRPVPAADFACLLRDGLPAARAGACYST